ARLPDLHERARDGFAVLIPHDAVDVHDLASGLADRALASGEVRVFVELILDRVEGPFGLPGRLVAGRAFEFTAERMGERARGCEGAERADGGADCGASADFFGVLHQLISWVDWIP